MNTQIPRDPNNRFALDQNKIKHVLILQDDNGESIYAIASCGELNDDLYFENFSPQLAQLLINFKNCEYKFSEIKVKLDSGIAYESLVFQIKKLLN